MLLHSPSTNFLRKTLQAGLLFFVSVFWGFFPLFTAIFTFPQERAMLVKERSVNMYKLSAYFIARITTDLLLDLVLPVTFLLIVYFMVGLKLTFNAFCLTLLTILLSIIAAQVRIYDFFFRYYSLRFNLFVLCSFITHLKKNASFLTTLIFPLHMTCLRPQD